MKTLNLIFLLILLVGHPGSGTRIEPEPTPEPVIVAAEEAPKAPVESNLVIDLTNQERAKVGLASLERNQLLTDSAIIKACDLRDRDYWAHIHPDGPTPWEVIEGVGYTYRYAGENICRVFNEYGCMNAWMASEKHKENILDSRYKEIGVGKCGGFTVQHFGSK